MNTLDAHPFGIDCFDLGNQLSPILYSMSPGVVGLEHRPRSLPHGQDQGWVPGQVENCTHELMGIPRLHNEAALLLSYQLREFTVLGADGNDRPACCGNAINLAGKNKALAFGT